MAAETTNFVYLLYGSQEDCYLEAAYSIGTLLQNTDSARTRVWVYTDQPEKIKHWPATSMPAAHRLAEWRGATNYALRAKICVCLDCLQHQAGNLIFVDSDTFVRGNLQRLADQLSPGRALLHGFESRNPLPELAAVRFPLTGLGLYAYGPDSWMWNTGVIGLHQQDVALMQHALELCDALLAAGWGSRWHVMEQFAISEVMRLARVAINPAQGSVVHYYKAKPYMRQRISRMRGETGKEPWQFPNHIRYWWPYVKLQKWLSRLTP